MAKYLAQLILMGGQVLGRALARAVRQEIEASQEAARRLGNQNNAHKSAVNVKLGLTVDEAKQILDVKNLTHEEIKQRYEFLFNKNEPKDGGSLYLQSKVVRAKERLEHELKDKIDPEAQHVKESK